MKPLFPLSLIQVLFAMCAAYSVGTLCNKIDFPDFYWREYNGAVPFDAIEGGKDRLGRPTYVGQAAVYKIGNIPASIYHGNSSAVTSSAITYYIDRNVKVLCSKDSAHKFKWIPTDTDKMALITNCLVIPGGLDYDDYAYIARVQYEGEVRIGKVLKKWNGILIPYRERELILKDFELLVFDCKDNDSNSIEVH